MSNKDGFNKTCKDCECCEECRSFSKFRVSSCPQEPIVPQDGPVPPFFIPVYGSLYGSALEAVTGSNVDFDTVGPFSGTTPNTVDDSITVNSQGVYTITFTTEVIASGPPESFNSVVFRLSVNGTPIVTKQIEFQTFITLPGEVDTLSRTDQLELNQGDVIRVFILSSSGVSYFNPALVVTKVA